MPVIMGALVVSTNTVSMAVHSMLRGAFGPIDSLYGRDLLIKIVSTLVLFLAYEIGYWVDHYLKHRITFLWEFHKLHHTAEVLTPLTNFRNHPIAILFLDICSLCSLEAHLAYWRGCLVEIPKCSLLTGKT